MYKTSLTTTALMLNYFDKLTFGTLQRFIVVGPYYLLYKTNYKL